MGEYMTCDEAACLRAAGTSCADLPDCRRWVHAEGRSRPPDIVAPGLRAWKLEAQGDRLAAEEADDGPESGYVLPPMPAIGGYAIPAALDPGMSFEEACAARPGRIGDNAGVEAVLKGLYGAEQSVCHVGSCDRPPDHEGVHRCRCGVPVEDPAPGCAWHEPPWVDGTDIWYGEY